MSCGLPGADIGSARTQDEGPPDASIFRSRQPRRAAPPAPPGALSAVDGLV